MDYIVTFEDGATAYLEHHGVKGMKWGVRNAETRARYASRGKQDRQLAKVNKSYQRALQSERRAYAISANPNLGKALGTTPEKADRATAKSIEKHKKELAKSSRLGTRLSYDVTTGRYQVHSYADQNLAERRRRIDDRVKALPKVKMKDGTTGTHTMLDQQGNIILVEGFNDSSASRKARRKGRQAANSVAKRSYKNDSQRLSAMGEAYVKTVLEYEWGVRKR